MDMKRKAARGCGQQVAQQETTVQGGCSSKRRDDKFQAFPQGGILAGNADLPFALLLKTLRQEQTRVCSYIIRTVSLNHDTGTFEHSGSAPNFQGDMLTLCTCKHQMRSTRTVDEWTEMWIAGFTSRTKELNGKHWLFYLAEIESAYESHAQLWNVLPAKARNAKSAQSHYLGDVFKPIAPLPDGEAQFSPTNYVAPNFHSHRQNEEDDGWHKDINYIHTMSGRRPPLLVANPQHTYLWQEPVIYLDQDHCRDFSKWDTLQELLPHLHEVGR